MWFWTDWFGRIIDLHDLQPIPLHRTIYFYTKIQIKANTASHWDKFIFFVCFCFFFWEREGRKGFKSCWSTAEGKKNRFFFFFPCSIFLVLCLFYCQSTGLMFSEAGLVVFVWRGPSLEYFVLIDHERRFRGEPHRAVPVHLRDFSDLWEEEKK